MLPYILLIVVSIVFSFVSLVRSKEGGPVNGFLIGNDDYTKKHNLSIVFFLITFFLVLSLRHPTIGRDILRYKYYFEVHSSLPLSAHLKFEVEILFNILNWIIGHITQNFQFYIFVISAICVIPLLLVYAKEREHGFLMAILFMNMPTFIMSFSGVRQVIAMSIGLLAYRCVQKKKIIPYLLLCVLSIGFHHTGFMLFFLYPTYYLRFNRRALKYIIPGFVFFYIFNGRIFNALTDVLSLIMGEEYDVEINYNGAITMLLLFLVMCIVSYVFTDEDQMDTETMGLRNYLVIATFLQCFTSLHVLAMRMNYYFIIFIPLAMVKVVKNIEKRSKKDALLIEGVMIAFFTIYYLYNTYNSCKTGLSALDTYPYRAFWNQM